MYVPTFEYWAHDSAFVITASFDWKFATTATAADELHDNIIIIYDRGELGIFKSVSTKNKS